MGTHAEIRIPNNDGTFTFVMVGNDGYPEHMIPSLELQTANLGLDELVKRLIAAREVRFMDQNEIESYRDARSPRRDSYPEGQFYYTYAHGDKGWELV